MQEAIAEILLEIGAVGFKPHQPITFKSGLVSPVYVDNRRFPFHPQAWKQVIDGFVSVIEQEKIDFSIIAGIETAGIPHSAALGYRLEKPSVFVRKKVKDHGTKSRIEGGAVASQRVLLIEDHVTTGGSSLAGVEALREDTADVTDCLSITSYEFKEADEAFEKAGVKLHTLTTFPTILEVALAKKIFGETEKEIISDWLRDPAGWAGRHGH
jgi:orotate phosphoribosyltransferase